MHIHLDLVGGLAGDMFIAAALDAELVSREYLEEVFRKMGLGDGIGITQERVARGALTGSHIDFFGWDPAQESDHRHLSEILKMIDDAQIEEGIKAIARDLFIALGKAESKIHGIPLDKVHFHEVGAVDSILDFIGAAAIIHHAKATWTFSEVPSGYGEIVTAHGVIPVPAPATADLLRGLPTIERDVRGELVTPTGAAILHVLAGLHKAPELKLSGFKKAGGKSYSAPKRTVQRRGTLIGTGYGCGTKSFKDLANVVRLLIFERESAGGYERDSVMRIETEIDDMQPELLAWFCEKRLPELGALDVTRAAVHMKKGRIGSRITVLCEVGHSDVLVDALLRETSTFGVRVDEVERVKLARTLKEVQTIFGVVRVKVGMVGEEQLKASPEFEDCARLAAEHGVTISEVYQAALSVPQVSIQNGF